MPETRRREASTTTTTTDVDQLVEQMENGSSSGNNDPEASGFILKLYQMISNAPDDAVMVRYLLPDSFDFACSFLDSNRARSCCCTVETVLFSLMSCVVRRRFL